MFPNTHLPAFSFLAVHPWFAHLPRSQQNQLCERMESIKGTKGEVLLRAHVPVTGWYAVFSGLIKVQTAPIKGRSSSFLGVATGLAKDRP